MRNIRFNNYLHHVFNNKDLNSFFLAMTFRMFAINLLAIFLPAVMWNQGFGLREIGLFYFIWTIAHSFTSLNAARLVRRIHAKKVFYLAIPFYISFFALIGSITLKTLILTAVIAGIGNGLFWLAYHLYFSSKADTESRGRKISTLQFLTGVVMMIAPIVGGFFLEHAGYYWLISIMALLLFVSLIPLRDIKHERIHVLSARKISSIILSKTGFAYIARGSAGAPIWVVWPLMLFLLFEGFMNLGIVTFITSFVALVLMLFVGHIIDKIKYHKALKIASFMESFINVAKVFISIPFVAIIVDALEKIVMKSYFVIFDARSYELGRDPQHIVAREICINLGASLVMLAIFIFPSFKLAFILGAIGALWSMTL